MDWKRFDRARESASPLELDLVENYAKGRISRRNFVKRGTMIGLSVPFMGSIIAACGGDDDDATPADDTGGEDTADATNDGTSETPAAGGGDIIAGIQTGDATSGLDPLNMLDLGTYCVLSQSFEYLVGLGDDGNIAATGLAESWEPNEDGSAWTFTLRPGVQWMGGGTLTSADATATIDRMAAVGAGLAGVVSEGNTETIDDLTFVVNLDSPNGNLPVLLSLFNPQSLITPADYASGTVLNERTTGTGAWMLDDFDPGAFRARFVPNPDWWGGSVNLDSVTLQGFDTGGTKVAALAAGEIDVIQDFTINDGATLLDDPNVVVMRPPSANHRQLWFNTQLPEGGPFTDPRVRQAVCYAVNRQQIVDTIYEGQAVIGNDHPISETLPFFDETQEQRPYDPEMARQLLADAGYDGGVEDVLQVGEIGEVPQLAAIVQANLAEVGINVQVGVSPNSDFYGEYWCTESTGPTQPCGTSASIGIVDYGHRPTPDVYFGRALATGGDWNSSNYASSEFDTLFGEYQASLDVEGQKAAVGKIQRLLHEDAPACYHSFFNYLAGHSTEVDGIQTTALGHLYFQNATKG
ncbi:MAG: ABC transporter substrate-binding protein [Ilumatobacteraceae bacterium]|nr:ABC transporter substrate-binding protein [Ilumatobacteraceae bacterium]